MEIIRKPVGICHNCGNGNHYIQNCNKPHRCKFGNNVKEKQNALFGIQKIKYF